MKLKTDRTKLRKNRHKWTSRRKKSGKREKKKKDNRHKLDVKGPLKHGQFFFFFFFGLYFGANKAHFFPRARQDQINSAPSARPLFFKGLLQRGGKGGKGGGRRGVRGCTPLLQRRGDARPIGKKKEEKKEFGR